MGGIEGGKLVVVRVNEGIRLVRDKSNTWNYISHTSSHLPPIIFSEYSFTFLTLLLTHSHPPPSISWYFAQSVLTYSSSYPKLFSSITTNHLLFVLGYFIECWKKKVDNNPIMKDWSYACFVIPNWSAILYIILSFLIISPRTTFTPTLLLSTSTFILLVVAVIVVVLIGVAVVSYSTLIGE